VEWVLIWTEPTKPHTPRCFAGLALRIFLKHSFALMPSAFLEFLSFRMRAATTSPSRIILHIVRQCSRGVITLPLVFLQCFQSDPVRFPSKNPLKRRGSIRRCSEIPVIASPESLKRRLGRGGSSFRISSRTRWNASVRIRS